MLPGSQFVTRFVTLAVVLTASSWAQFSGSIQGMIQDPAGAVVPNAKVQLKNTETNVAASTTSDAEGNYRFVSLAPGSYQINVEASGFNTTAVSFTLATSQNLNVPVSMKVATAAQWFAILAGALCAAIVLALEGCLGVVALGSVFDRFDASRE